MSIFSVARTGTITITGLAIQLSVSVTQSGLPQPLHWSVVIGGSEQTSAVPLTPGTGWVDRGSGTERSLNQPGCPGSPEVGCGIMSIQRMG